MLVLKNGISPRLLLAYSLSLVLIIFWVGGGGVVVVESSKCGGDDGCEALASYYLWDGATLTVIARVLSTTINTILDYNPQITNPNLIQMGSRVNVPFSCGCFNGEFMAHQFVYQSRPGNTYQRISSLVYSNLTTVEMLEKFNNNNNNNSQLVNVVVNCSCGNSKVSKDYGLFISYPLRVGESLSSVANEFDLPEKLLEDYNPGMDFGNGSGLIFVPGKGNLIKSISTNRLVPRLLSLLFFSICRSKWNFSSIEEVKVSLYSVYSS